MHSKVKTGISFPKFWNRPWNMCKECLEVVEFVPVPSSPLWSPSALKKIMTLNVAEALINDTHKQNMYTDHTYAAVHN